MMPALLNEPSTLTRTGGIGRAAVARAAGRFRRSARTSRIATDQERESGGGTLEIRGSFVAITYGLVIIPIHGAVNTILGKITNEAVMLTTGNQLRAARGLVAMDQTTLAQRAGVSANTIRAMEARGTETLTSGLDTVRAVQSALEAAGVEFLDHGRPGVRLKDVRP